MDTTEKKGLIQKYKDMSKWQKFAFWSSNSILVYTLFGFFAAPHLVKIVLEKKIPELVQRSVSIGKIKLNPYTLTASIENFTLKQKDSANNFVSFDQLFINLQSSSLFKQALVVKSTKLSGPMVAAARISEQTYSFSDLIKESSPKKDGSNAPILFSINNIEIINGTIHFDDQPKNKEHLLSNLNLTIPTISNLPSRIDTNVQPSFSVQINGTNLALSGTTKPFAQSRETVVKIKLSKLNLPEYLAYVPNQTAATLKTGSLAIDSQLSYIDNPGDRQLALKGLISLTNINIVDTQEVSYGRFPKIDLIIAPSNLLQQEIVVESITLTEPEIDISRNNEGTILPISLFEVTKERTSAEPESDKEIQPSPPVDLAIGTISLKDGKVTFIDQAAENFTSSLSPLNLTLTKFSTEPQSVADFLLQFTTEGDEDFSTQGQAGLSPLFVDGRVELSKLPLPKYMPYLKSVLTADITDGQINLSTHFHMEKSDNNSQTRLDDLSCNLKNLSIDNGSETILSLPRLDLSGSSIDLESQQVRIGNLASQSGKFYLQKNATGELNLSQLVKDVDNKEIKSTRQDETDSQEIPPWIVSLDKGNFDSFTVSFTDNGPSTPVTTEISDLSVDLSSISTRTNSVGDVNFSLAVNGNGKLLGKGSLGLSPFSADLAVDSTLTLPPLQNYVADHLQIFIRDGTLSTKGQLNLVQDDELRASFSGETTIADLVIADSAGEDLLKWKKLLITGEEFTTHPQKYAIEEIDWQNPFMQLTVLKDGTFNLSHINTPQPENSDVESATAVKDEPEQQEGPEIIVNTFKLADGALNFTDRNVSPAYAANLEDVAGSVTGLSSHIESLALVELNGKVNQHAPVKVSGSLNPLKEDIFADLKIDFNDLDLSPTSPYTGKFIGYKTEKGKLTLNLHYTVNGKDIKGQNSAFLDQFTLGDFVESPDAVSLPIQLAIALLKNRSGEIFLDIPVAGNLDDPEFSVASVVFRVLFNLIAKAATSPFALLGALIPDGEDLQYVTFEPGSSELVPDTVEKLTKMASVLFDRPGLRMDIQGSSSPKQDRLSLAQGRLQQLVKLQKIKEAGSSKKVALPSDDSVELSPEEYIHYLTLAYNESLLAMDKDVTTDSTGQKNEKKQLSPPANDSPKDKVEPPTKEFMEAALLKEISITEEDLRLLAVQRGSSVLNFLAQTGPVEPERLFLIEPKISSDLSASADSAAQVDLIIK